MEKFIALMFMEVIKRGGLFPSSFDFSASFEKKR